MQKGENMTKFIGFKRKNGNFTNKDTGEVVTYDNYDLYFITGNVPDIIGYYPSEYRVKGNVIRQVLGIEAKSGDDFIFDILYDMLNKEVMLSVLSVDEKPVVTGLMVIPSPSVDTKNSK